MERFSRDSKTRQLFLVLGAAVLGIAGVLAAPSAQASGTLEKVRSVGEVRCGISEEQAGFSFRDASGRWQGFMVDFCRAVAAATLGDAERVAYLPLTPAGRFPALLAGKVDLLSHKATMTFGREAGIGVQFAGIYFFDGQTFMASRKHKVRKIDDLKGSTICVEKGTTSLENLDETFRARGLVYKPLVFDSLGEAKKAFVSGKCTAYTDDRSTLAAIIASAPGGTSRYAILPENISKEPLGPVVRRGDELWLTLVRWVLFALIEAEERGVTKGNVRSLQKKAGDPALQRFLNTSGRLGRSLGIEPDWVANVIAQVGNYGEIYERHFGPRGPLAIPRGPNNLWTKGGLMYAPPLR